MVSPGLTPWCGLWSFIWGNAWWHWIIDFLCWRKFVINWEVFQNFIFLSQLLQCHNLTILELFESSFDFQECMRILNLSFFFILNIVLTLISVLMAISLYYLRMETIYCIFLVIYSASRSHRVHHIRSKIVKRMSILFHHFISQLSFYSNQ